MNKQLVKENFFNPFASTDDEKVDKKPKRINDGGLLKPRKEIFNINRVEYSKRPNGEFTVLAKTQFARGEIIEIAPVILVGIEVKGVGRLKDYVFELNKDDGTYGVVLGYGSLYKHSDEPNVQYGYNKSNKQMYFLAGRPIKAQEELTINYGKDYWTERMSFNTMAPKISPTPLADETNESGEQGGADNAIDVTGEMSTKTLSHPQNPHNPVRSGVAIRGMGQQ